MEEFVKRMEEREKKRKQLAKMRLIRFIVILFFVLIIFLFATLLSKCTKQEGVETLESNAYKNEYIMPLAPATAGDILSALNLSDGEKVCYLTFDDGPTNSVTSRVLDILRRYNIKATFFTVGTLIEANPDMARRIYDEGHTLANHSYLHTYSKLYSDGDSFMSEVRKTEELIKNITGDENYPKIFRFPGGSFNSGYYGEQKQKYKKLLDEEGYRYCDWNALNGDAEGKKVTAEDLTNRVKSSTKNKEDVVILMHDAAAKSTTADSLTSTIEYLISQGYTFKTLDEAPKFKY